MKVMTTTSTKHTVVNTAAPRRSRVHKVIPTVVGASPIALAQPRGELQTPEYFDSTATRQLASLVELQPVVSKRSDAGSRTRKINRSERQGPENLGFPGADRTPLNLADATHNQGEQVLWS